MFELLLLGLMIVMGGVLLLKVLFFLMGLVFSGVGLILKMLLTVVFGVLFFPVGAIVLGTFFSGGLFLFLLVLIGLGALISEKQYPRGDGHREYHREY